jgi:hypothetical protein
VSEKREDMIAALVPIGIIDDLEMVEIGEDQTETGASTTRRAKGGIEFAEELPAIHQIGQSVMAGLIAEPLFRRFALGDIDARGDDVVDAPGYVHENGVGPAEEARAVERLPMILVMALGDATGEIFKDRLDRLTLLVRHEDVPTGLVSNCLKGFPVASSQA